MLYASERPPAGYFAALENGKERDAPVTNSVSLLQIPACLVVILLPQISHAEPSIDTKERSVHFQSFHGFFDRPPILPGQIGDPRKLGADPDGERIILLRQLQFFPCFVQAAPNGER